jgi:hypothetical protein
MMAILKLIKSFLTEGEKYMDLRNKFKKLDKEIRTFPDCLFHSRYHKLSYYLQSRNEVSQIQIDNATKFRDELKQKLKKGDISWNYQFTK